jgi:DNA-binding response OmpR family regulator
MKIAIILEDFSARTSLAKNLQETDWIVDFFRGSLDFGRAHLSEYDIIISDISTSPIDGRQILNSIQGKTQAELYLMGNGSFSEKDIYNDHIKGLINKNDVKDLYDKINYVSVKKRLQHFAATEIPQAI